jgi:hypothetical protein
MELLIDDHLKYQQEHRQLLTVQVVLTDRLDKLAGTVETVTKNLTQAVASLAEAQRYTDRRLNALIHVPQQPN